MDRNIFDAAAKKLQKKKSAKVKQDVSGASAPDRPVKDTDSSSEYGNHDPEIVSMFAKMREMRHDLESQLGEVRAKGERSQIDVDKYIETTTNFRPSDLEKVSRDQKQFEDKIDTLFKPEACLKKVQKGHDKLGKERKAKTLGARKKWLPMR